MADKTVYSCNLTAHIPKKVKKYCKPHKHQPTCKYVKPLCQIQSKFPNLCKVHNPPKTSPPNNLPVLPTVKPKTLQSGEILELQLNQLYRFEIGDVQDWDNNENLVKITDIFAWNKITNNYLVCGALDLEVNEYNYDSVSKTTKHQGVLVKFTGINNFKTTKSAKYLKMNNGLIDFKSDDGITNYTFNPINGALDLKVQLPADRANAAVSVRATNSNILFATECTQVADLTVPKHVYKLTGMKMEDLKFPL